MNKSELFQEYVTETVEVETWVDPVKVERVYNYICGYKLTNDGNSPTYREIVANVPGISSICEVKDYLDELEKLGKITTIGRGLKRFIKIVGAQWIPPEG